MDLKKNFKKKVLSNGLTILFEKRSVPVTSIAIGIRQGGMHESEKEKGISHFIEHMAFKGTRKRTQLQISREIEEKGGELNAFTDESETVYHCKVPSIYTFVGLDVLSDIVLNSTFPEKEVIKERKVILEEIKMRRDSPKHYSLDNIQSLLFSKPFGLDLIGSPKTLKNIKRKDLLKKYKDRYTPDNMVLSVVGNCSFEKVLKFAKKTFPSKKSLKEKVSIFEVNKSKVEKRKGIKQANFLFAVHLPKANSKGVFAAEILSSLLGGGMSSRLFQEIREKRNLAYTVVDYTNCRRDYSYLLIYVGCKKNNVEKIKKLILEEFKKVSEGLEKEEFEREKEALVGAHLLEMEDSATQSESLIFHENDFDANLLYDYPNYIRKVKIEEVKNLAKKIYEGEYSIFTLVPKN